MNDFTGPRRIELVEFERRVLDAARREQPAATQRERMAAGIGLSSVALGGAVEGAVGTMTGSPELSPLEAAGSQGGSGAGAALSSGATGAGTLAPWVSGALLTAAVTAAAVLFYSTDEAARLPVADQALPNIEAPAETSIREPLPPEPSSVPAIDDALDLPRAAEPPRVRSKVSSGLREEIALIDAARAAVQSGAGSRALALLGDYSKRYPRGSFLPEATAVKVEALMSLGRTGEARALAERFIAQRPGTPLAERVARVTGLEGVHSE